MDTNTIRETINEVGIKLYADAVKAGATPSEAREALRAALLAEAEKLEGSFFSS